MSDQPSIPSSPVSGARPNLSAVVNSDITQITSLPHSNSDGKGTMAKDKSVKLSNMLNPPDVQEKLKAELSNEKAPDKDKTDPKVPETQAEQKEAEKVTEKLDDKPGLNAELNAELNDDGTITLKMGELEEKVTLAEAKRLAQMGKNAHNTWKEADKMKKTAEFQLGQVKQLMQMISTNTKDVLYDPRLKIDLQALTNSLIDDQVKWSHNPALKDNYYMKRQLDEKAFLEQQAQQQKDTEAKTANENTLIKEYTSKINQTMIDHGMKGADQQANKLISDQIVRYLLQGVNSGLNLQPSDVIEQVKKDYVEYINRIMLNMTDEQLENTVPPAFLDKIRKINISKLSGPEKKAEIKKVVQSEAPKKPAKPKTTKMTPFEVKSVEHKSQRQSFKDWVSSNEEHNS